MIGSLRGRVIDIGATSFLLEVAGIGYRVRTSPSLIATLKRGEESFVYIHDHIREDAHELFGFAQEQDLALFEQLLGISGVGPKVAMTILSVGSADHVRGAIMKGDLDTLTSVPGVGKKTAQKIVLELKGQLVDAETETTGDHEVVEALVSLGYSASQARETVKHLPVDMTDTSDRVREALRSLSK